MGAIGSGVKRVGTALGVAALLGVAAFAGGSGPRAVSTPQMQWHGATSAANGIVGANSATGVGTAGRALDLAQMGGIRQNALDSPIKFPQALSAMGVSQREYEESAVQFEQEKGAQRYDWFGNKARNGAKESEQSGKRAKAEGNNPLGGNVRAQQRVVNKVNAHQFLWKAAVYPELAMVGAAGFLAMAGILKGEESGAEAEKGKETAAEERDGGKKARELRRADAEGLPEQFDARQRWPQCADVIGRIQDQTNRCDSCWAVASASMMSDRICIASNGARKVDISAKKLLSCAQENGCRGGNPMFALYHWLSKGVVDSGCQRYPDFGPGYVLQCRHRCDTEDGDRTKHYGTDPVWARREDFLEGAMMEDAIRREIHEHGPVVGQLKMYRDLANYSSGIYKKVSGWSPLYSHAVRIIGWGEEAVEGPTGGCAFRTEQGDCKRYAWTRQTVKYWIVANSWGTGWGENGLFRIVRGLNQNGVEEDFWAAKPDLSRC